MFQINVIYSLVIINVLYLPVCPLSSLRKLLPLKLLLSSAVTSFREFPVQEQASESRKYPALGHTKRYLNPNILPKAHKTNGKAGSSAAQTLYSRHVQSAVQVEDSACLGLQSLETSGGHVPLSEGSGEGQHQGSSQQQDEILEIKL